MKYPKYLAGPVLLLFFIAANVDSAEINTPSIKNGDISSFAQLDALRSQNAILTEKLKNLELLSKLGGADQRPSSTQVSGNQNGSMKSAVKASPSPFLATAEVQMVSSAPGGGLMAIISLDNGRQAVAKVGRMITGLGTVKSISLDEVLIDDKKDVVSLPFATEKVVPNALSSGLQVMQAPSIMANPPLPSGASPVVNIPVRGGR